MISARWAKCRQKLKKKEPNRLKRTRKSAKSEKRKKLPRKRPNRKRLFLTKQKQNCRRKRTLRLRNSKETLSTSSATSKKPLSSTALPLLWTPTK